MGVFIGGRNVSNQTTQKLTESTESDIRRIRTLHGTGATVIFDPLNIKQYFEGPHSQGEVSRAIYAAVSHEVAKIQLRDIQIMKLLGLEALKSYIEKLLSEEEEAETGLDVFISNVLSGNKLELKLELQQALTLLDTPAFKLSLMMNLLRAAPANLIDQHWPQLRNTYINTIVQGIMDGLAQQAAQGNASKPKPQPDSSLRMVLQPAPQSLGDTKLGQQPTVIFIDNRTEFEKDLSKRIDDAVTDESPSKIAAKIAASHNKSHLDERQNQETIFVGLIENIRFGRNAQIAAMSSLRENVERNSNPTQTPTRNIANIARMLHSIFSANNATPNTTEEHAAVTSSTYESTINPALSLTQPTPGNSARRKVRDKADQLFPRNRPAGLPTYEEALEEDGPPPAYSKN